MTHMKQVLALLADGKSRTKEEIMKETGLTGIQVGQALQKSKRSGNTGMVWAPAVYVITEVGKQKALKPEYDRKAAEQARSAKRREEKKKSAERRKSRAEIRAANARMRAERELQKQKETSVVFRALSGAIPNSVFSMARAS